MAWLSIAEPIKEIHEEHFDRPSYPSQLGSTWEFITGSDVAGNLAIQSPGIVQQVDGSVALKAVFIGGGLISKHINGCRVRMALRAPDAGVGLVGGAGIGIYAKLGAWTALAEMLTDEPLNTITLTVYGGGSTVFNIDIPEVGGSFQPYGIEIYEGNVNAYWASTNVSPEGNWEATMVFRVSLPVPPSVASLVAPVYGGFQLTQDNPAFDPGAGDRMIVEGFGTAGVCVGHGMNPVWTAPTV